MKEIFKDIPNYEGCYQVSNLGNVKSFYFRKESILKPKKNKGGYHIVCLYKDYKSKQFQVHQLVAMAFLNHVPNGSDMVVNHINFIRTDNRLVNLEIVNQRTNTNRAHLPSSSKYIGVSWNKKDKVWFSQIRINKKLHHLGSFKCELKASEAYQNKLKQITK
jgi:AAA15 family ATPase/GTPase